MIKENPKSKKAIIIWILIIACVIIFSIIGTLVISWFWLIFLPLSFLLVVAFQALSEHFWSPTKTCPRCNAPLSIYSEYCRNCGLKLIRKCPYCGNLMPAQVSTCNRCGHELGPLEQPKKPLDFELIKKGQLLPEKPNYCPTCGASLIKIDHEITSCPYCGADID